MLLVEILSPGNERDTWENVWTYATIPSVQEILVVHSTRIRAELLRRSDELAWPETPEAIGPDGILRLESIDFTCPLPELYAETYLV